MLESTGWSITGMVSNVAVHHIRLSLFCIGGRVFVKLFEGFSG
jgi:hypothetical protein